LSNIKDAGISTERCHFEYWKYGTTFNGSKGFVEKNRGWSNISKSLEALVNKWCP